MAKLLVRPQELKIINGPATLLKHTGLVDRHVFDWYDPETQRLCYCPTEGSAPCCLACMDIVACGTESKRAFGISSPVARQMP